MLEPFHGYFQEIDLPGPLIVRAEQLCETFAQAIQGAPNRIFVNDFFYEGARRYSSLWLFTERHIIEVKNFVVQQQLDFTRLADLNYVELIRSDLLPFDPAGRETTLHAQAKFKEGLHANFSATGSNCRHLYDLVLTYLMPR